MRCRQRCLEVLVVRKGGSDDRLEVRIAKDVALTDPITKVRLDRWLWAARFYKTRSIASEGVKGGKVYGQWRGLTPDKLFEGRDLTVTTDFRDVFGEVLTKQLGVASMKPVFPGYDVKPLGVMR